MDERELVIELLKHEILLIGDFTLKSGLKSPYYLDLRLIPSYPKLFQEVVSLLAQKIQKTTTNLKGIAGIITAGIPFATGVCLKLQLPLLQVRSEVKDHGTKKLVEGVLPNDDGEVCLLDDVITTGLSKHNAIAFFRDQKIPVKYLFVVVDRSDKSMDLEKELGIKIHSLLNKKTILEVLNSLTKADIPSHFLDKIKTFLSEPLT